MWPTSADLAYEIIACSLPGICENNIVQVERTSVNRGRHDTVVRQTRHGRPRFIPSKWRRQCVLPVSLDDLLADGVGTILLVGIMCGCTDPCAHTVPKRILGGVNAYAWPKNWILAYRPRLDADVSFFSHSYRMLKVAMGRLVHYLAR